MPNEETKLEKREWMYCQKPSIYGIPGCACGNNDCEYSEYRDHLWCSKCQKDFVPEHWGVFDGPILVQACEMLGMFFHRIDLKTDHLQLFMPDNLNEKGEHQMVDVNLKPEELAVLKRFFVETAKQPEQKPEPQGVSDHAELAGLKELEKITPDGELAKPLIQSRIRYLEKKISGDQPVVSSSPAS